MSLSPANLLHLKTFAGRMLRPAIFVFFLGFLLCGIFADVWEEGIELPVVQMAQRQFARVAVDFREMPEVCIGGETSSTFQAQLCQARWSTLFLRLASVSLPFLSVLLFFFIARRIVYGAYSESDRKLREGRETFLGIVTEPALLPNDLYGWFHCAHVVSVQLKNKRQVRVYVPIEAGVPKPGEQLAVAPLGKRFGSSRAIGIVFIPHVAIVSGNH